jgi:hypothetical protein
MALQERGVDGGAVLEEDRDERTAVGILLLGDRDR